MITQPMTRHESTLTGQGVNAGQVYLIRKLRLDPNPWAVVSSAIVQDEDGYLYQVKNAHLFFDLQGTPEFDQVLASK